MTFWEFLDRRFSCVSASGLAGSGVFLLTGIVLYMLDRDRTLADNDLFKTLAQAIVVQGLIGLAMASWFTKDRSEPSQTRIVNDPTDPVPIVEEDHDPSRAG